jgi:hypothetical protein
VNVIRITKPFFVFGKTQLAHFHVLTPQPFDLLNVANALSQLRITSLRKKLRLLGSELMSFISDNYSYNQPVLVLLWDNARQLPHRSNRLCGHEPIVAECQEIPGSLALQSVIRSFPDDSSAATNTKARGASWFCER